MNYYRRLSQKNQYLPIKQFHNRNSQGLLFSLFPTQNTNYISQQINDLISSIESFLQDRKAQNLAEGTITFYQKKLKYFSDYCSKHNIVYVSDISPNHIRNYLLDLEGKGHNPGGVHAAYRSLKTLLNWWCEENGITNLKNPIRKIKPPRIPEELLEPIKSQHIHALLAICYSDSFFDIRDKAIILTLADTGTRAAELLAINKVDLDIDKNRILIQRGKGRKYRYAYFGNTTKDIFREYLSERTDDSPILWISKCNKRLSYSGLRSMIRRRSKSAGIPTPSIHAFRRYFALEMLRSGVDIFSLQNLMGHADTQILRRYLKQVDSDMEKAHLLGGPVDNMFRK